MKFGARFDILFPLLRIPPPREKKKQKKKKLDEFLPFPEEEISNA